MEKFSQEKVIISGSKYVAYASDNMGEMSELNKKCSLRSTQIKLA